MSAFERALAAMPLVAILRGLAPGQAAAVAEILLTAGMRVLEVPLSGADALESLAVLSERCAGRALVGAGTVRSPSEVAAVAAAGGDVIVMPHADIRIVAAAKDCGLAVVPGFATPTEAFACIEAGADALKLFPAETNPPTMLRALRAVLPQSVKVLPVGSITPESMPAYWRAGANGFGIGSALYRPERDLAALGARAQAFVAAARTLLAQPLRV